MFKKRRIQLAALFICVLSLVLCLPVLAAGADSSGNIFDAKDVVILPENPFFSAFAAGRTVRMENAKADGSVCIAANDAVINNSAIDESVYIGAANTVIDNANVKGNIFGSGNTLSVSGKSNGVYFIGNALSFNGTTRGLYCRGASCELKGKIKGDVNISASNIIIDPNLKVTGELKIDSEKEPEIPKSASIGTYTFKKVEPAKKSETEKKPVSGIQKKAMKTIYWMIALSLIAVIMCRLLNDHLSRAAGMFKEHAGVMIRNGILTWLLVPVCAVLMCVTVVLAPAGGILLLGYIILIIAGESFTAASVSRLILPNMSIYPAAIIGVVIFRLIKLIPVIGFIVGALCDMYLLAYVSCRLFGRKR